MRLRNEAKVGLIVFGAIVLLVVIYWFLGGLGLRASTYEIYAIFSNAQKLNKGSDVRMAGVKIGVVSSVDLTKNSRARVNMYIDESECIPRDSVARITQGGFIGDSYIEVVPGKSSKCVKAGQRVRTEQIVGFDQMMQEASALLSELRTTAKGINGVLGDKELVASLKGTVKAFQKSAESASSLIASAQGMLERSSPEVERTFANLADASEGAVAMSNEMQRLLAEDIRPNLKPLIAQTKQIMSELNTSLRQANAILEDVDANKGSIKELLDRANGAACQAEQMLANLNAASEGIKELATDKEFICNIKATARNAAQASEKANTALGSLTKKLTGTTGPTPEEKAAIPLYGISADTLWNIDKGKFRADANYTFSFGGDTFYRAGLYDIGEDTKINLQGGKMLGPNNSFRYGLYASRLGIGYDHRFGSNVLISTDLFRPDEPEMELRSIFGLTDNIGIYAGIADLFHKDDRDFLLGVNYQK